MKIVITYCQNKRTAMPYLFGKYALPMMEKVFPGEVKLYHIFHDLHVRDERLASNRADASGLARVREFVKTAPGAVVTHTEVFPDLYVLPSFRIGSAVAIKERADLHLWLEDDAIVYDPLCYLWPRLMRDTDIGLFRQTAHIPMANCAFLLTSYKFDVKFLAADFRDDGKEYPNSSPFETFLWGLAESHQVLHPGAANRHHPRGPFKTTTDDLAAWLQETIPNIEEQDLKLLREDFCETDESNRPT